MATMILSTAGSALFGPVGGFLGSLAGAQIDAAIASGLTPARVQPSRLSGLKLQGSAEGTPIPIVYGQFRLAGQIIWASRFREVNTKRTVGGKGGQRVVERSYTISFAIGLCEGPISGIDRVWINGELFDLSSVASRLYLGTETQMPDPLIEALEGLDDAPAFRGLAYIVFEDFSLAAYNDRVPQFSFEIIAHAKQSAAEVDLKTVAKGVCLIPGAGEFVYATTPIRRSIGPGQDTSENQHVRGQTSDLDVSLDQLKRDLPAVQSVSLVVAWFGTDLRAGFCKIVPKTDNPRKQTKPRAWSVAGLNRNTAQTVSLVNGQPAYGGSPDDHSIIECIVTLKARGLAVTYNPFVMMDIPANNNLPNPTGGIGQPPYPWRGRISCFPAIGQAGSVDGTAAAATQISAFFGTSLASHFQINAGGIAYSGPNDWSYSRFILYQAALAKAAGGVETFLLGSELIGLTKVRDGAGNFPAVAHLKALAGEVRALLGTGPKLSYSADWTEYGAYAPPGTSDLRFPLDALWADPNIGFIGLDWYAPLSDRRDGDPRPNRAEFQSGIEGGEAYDFYYASEAHRSARTRTPITDGAYNEAWVWRQKDIRSFWSNPHFERLNGVRQTTPTAWVPKSKPIRLMELGFPAVDKGANRPSVFPDPKSAEAGLPPFSNGQRDDAEQRVALGAVLSYWAANNPNSPLYNGPMMALDRCHLWAWDARPHPHFPRLTSVWSDGIFAAKGHWLSGRTSVLTLSNIIEDIAARAGLLDLDASAVTSSVTGYAIEAPTTSRALLDSLIEVFGLEALSLAQGVVVRPVNDDNASHALGKGQIGFKDNRAALNRISRAEEKVVASALTTYASDQDYAPATYKSGAYGKAGPKINLTTPVVLDGESRKIIANRLAQSSLGEGLTLEVAPALAARLEAGDRLVLADGSRWRAERLGGGWQLSVVAGRPPRTGLPIDATVDTGTLTKPDFVSAPALVVLDLPAPFTSPTQPTPLIGAATNPWVGEVDVRVNDQILAKIIKPMTFGSVTAPFSVTDTSRVLNAALFVDIFSDRTLLQTGTLAIQIEGQTVDIITWRSAALVQAGRWRLAGVVRGYQGGEIGISIPIGSLCIVLDDALVPAQLDTGLQGSLLHWRASPVSDLSIETNLDVRFLAMAAKPWSPCHLRAKRIGGGILITWQRRGRGNGDGWGPVPVPLGSAVERYNLLILDENGQTKREVVVDTPSFLYSSSVESADFQAPSSQLFVGICQVGDGQLLGDRTYRTLKL